MTCSGAGLFMKGANRMTGIPVSLLDNIRISNGPDSLRNYFNDLYHTRRSKLPKLLNDRHLHFYTLFLLKPDIYAFNLQEKLIPVYKWALHVSDRLSETIGNQIHGGNTAARRAEIRKDLRTEPEIIPSALKWIVETGWDADVPEGSYELLLERCTAMLLLEFRDKSVLPLIADIIFARNRAGLLIHNLVWLFFEAHDTDSLCLLAQRLASASSADVSLARKLLRFIPGTGTDKNGSGTDTNTASGADRNSVTDTMTASGSALYFKAIRWLSENRPYLYFTGESMQMCTNPLFCQVSLEAKYLGRHVSPETGRMQIPPRDDEAALLEEFRRLTPAQQRQMAEFSRMMSSRNIYQWNSWIRLPFFRQLEAASRTTGGSE